MPAFYVIAKDLNSVPHPYAARILPVDVLSPCFSSSHGVLVLLAMHKILSGLKFAIHLPQSLKFRDFK